MNVSERILAEKSANTEAGVRMVAYVPVDGTPTQIFDMVNIHALQLDAIANNPKCRDLVIVPLDVSGNRPQIWNTGYRVDLEKWRSETRVSRDINEYANECMQQLLVHMNGEEGWRISITPEMADKTDMVYVMPGIKTQLGQAELQKHFPNSRFVQDSEAADIWGGKRSLMELKDALGPRSDVIPHVVVTNKEHLIEDFMNQHGGSRRRVILKENEGAQGSGVHLLYDLDGVLTVRSLNTGKEEPLHDYLTSSAHSQDIQAHGVLLMEELNPEPGDMRVIAVNGKVLGSYNRLQVADALGKSHSVVRGHATREYSELKPSDKERLQPVVNFLNQEGASVVGLDLMSDWDGKWRLSEVNTGLVSGFKFLAQQAQANDTDCRNNPFMKAMSDGILSLDRKMDRMESHELARFLGARRAAITSGEPSF